MYFGKNDKANKAAERDLSSILSFFYERDKDELSRLADELSDEAKDFFDGSVQSLLGYMPEEIADTIITMNKSALNQLLYSSMITGYITKSVEDKLKLEKLWQDEKQDQGTTETLIDRLMQRSTKKVDDIDDIL